MGLCDHLDLACGDGVPPGEIPFEQWVRDKISDLWDKIAELEQKLNNLGSGIGLVLSGTAKNAKAYTVSGGWYADCVSGGGGGELKIEPCGRKGSGLGECPTIPATLTCERQSNLFLLNGAAIIVIPTSGTVTRIAVGISPSLYSAEFGWNKYRCNNCSWGWARWPAMNGQASRAETAEYRFTNGAYFGGFSNTQNTSLWVNAGDIITVFSNLPGQGSPYYAREGMIPPGTSSCLEEYNPGGGVDTFASCIIARGCTINAQVVLNP